MEWKPCRKLPHLPFQETLETSLVEWKPASPRARHSAIRPLETSLVEWKRRQRVNVRPRRLSLGNFLSGMETESSSPAAPSSIPLETSLVEWKPVAIGVYHAGVRHLGNFLSGMETGVRGRL